jgi:hypothetical protein
LPNASENVAPLAAAHERAARPPSRIGLKHFPSSFPLHEKLGRMRGKLDTLISVSRPLEGSHQEIDHPEFPFSVITGDCRSYWYSAIGNSLISSSHFLRK